MKASPIAQIMSKRKILTTMALLAIVAFHFLNNFFWIGLDQAPTGIGVDWHLLEAVKFQIAYKRILYSDSSMLDKLTQAYHLFATWPNGNSPPLIYLLSSIANTDHFRLFDTRCYFNAFFLCLLIFSTYFLAKKLFSRRAGVFAAFLVSFYPLVGAYSRQFGPDFPLAAVTALSLTLLVYSEHYSNRLYSALLGLCLGIATLIKLQIVFFLAAPMIYMLWAGLKSNRRKKGKILFNFFVALFLSYLLFSVYWPDIFKEMAVNFSRHVFSLYPGFKGAKWGTLGSREIPVFSLDGITFYAGQLLNMMSWPLFVVFLISLGRLTKVKEKSKAFLLLCFFPPLLIFTLISVKFSKFILPLIPVMAVITAWAVMAIQKVFLRRAALLGVIIYSVLLFYYSSWLGDYNKFENILTISLDDGVCLWRPHREQYFSALKDSGVIKRIQNKLDQGDLVKIRFTNFAQDPMFEIYIFFQKYIFLNKLDIRLAEGGKDFNEAAYILLTPKRLSLNPNLMKQYRILRIYDDSDEICVLEQK